MGQDTGTAAARRRKLFALADHLGLSRDERMELAKVVLWRDITSWGQLDAAQVDRLLDSMEGYVYVTQLLMHRTDPELRRSRGPRPTPR